MLGFIAEVYEKWLNAIAIIFVVLFAILGLVVGNVISHFLYLDGGASFLLILIFVALGVLFGIIFDVMTFGFFVQIIVIRDRLEELCRNIPTNSEIKNIASEIARTASQTSGSSVASDANYWKCSCGADNPATASLCWQCGSHK